MEGAVDGCGVTCAAVVGSTVALGALEGVGEGLSVGALEGLGERAAEGNSDGAGVGAGVGAEVGEGFGDLEGSGVGGGLGAVVGREFGRDEGGSVGDCVGRRVGWKEGLFIGAVDVGERVGLSLGTSESSIEAKDDSSILGSRVGPGNGKNVLGISEGSVGSKDDGEGDSTRVDGTTDRAPLEFAEGSFVGGKVCGEVGAFDTGAGVGAFDGVSVGNTNGEVVWSDAIGSEGIEMR